jgi:protoporphyrinogen/coproporphyrinogen III oxidase
MYDHVISTLSSKAVSKITSLDSLANEQSVTIQVVNVVTKHPNQVPPGFGYLIPNSVPIESNPWRALGVLFDSNSLPKQNLQGDPEPYTRLTIMFGGHWWKDIAPEFLPTTAQAEEMARELLEHHLNIPRSDILAVSAQLAKDCIPQPLVGHWDRMGAAHDELLAKFNGRLSVAGASYHGLGVMSSARAGWDAAAAAARAAEGREPDRHFGRTGLAEFSRDKPEWVVLEGERLIPQFDDIFNEKKLEKYRGQILKLLRRNQG